MRKTILRPQWFITDRSRAMVPVGCFGVGVSVVFRFVFVHCIFGSVLVTGWPPFGGWLTKRLAICSHCVLSICNIYLFPVLVLRAGFAF